MGDDDASLSWSLCHNFHLTRRHLFCTHNMHLETPHLEPLLDLLHGMSLDNDLLGCWAHKDFGWGSDRINVPVCEDLFELGAEDLLLVERMGLRAE